MNMNQKIEDNISYIVRTFLSLIGDLNIAKVDEFDYKERFYIAVLIVKHKCVKP
jgi:hypothetical protein